MKKRLFMGFMFAAIMLVALGSVAYAHHRPGHSGGPGGGKGEDPPAGNAGIDLINCSEGIIATWGAKTNLTFKITDISGVGANIVDAVRAGVLEWSVVQTTYTLNEITSGTPDVNIDLFNKIVPGKILGAADVCSTSSGGVIQSVDISIGVKGLGEIGTQNVSAHEFGHALGLGHSDKGGDLMGARFERREEGKRIVCPSNLDVGGLTSSADPHTIPDANWAELAC